MQTTDSSKPGGDAVYQHLRRKGSSPEDFNAVASVRGLTIKRDAATFNFISGEVYFLAPVEGKVIGAVFLGDLEMTIVPPTTAALAALADVLYTSLDTK